MPIGDYFAPFMKANKDWSKPENRDKLLALSVLMDTVGQNMTKLDPSTNPFGGVATSMARGKGMAKATQPGAAPAPAAPQAGGGAPAQPSPESVQVDAYLKNIKANKDFFEINPMLGRLGLVNALDMQPGKYFGSLGGSLPENPTEGPRARDISSALAMALGPEGVAKARELQVAERAQTSTEAQVPFLNLARQAGAAAAQGEAARTAFDISEQGQQFHLKMATAAAEAAAAGATARDEAARAEHRQMVDRARKVPTPASFAKITGLSNYGDAMEALGGDVGNVLSTIQAGQNALAVASIHAKATGDAKSGEYINLFQALTMKTLSYKGRLTQEEWAQIPQAERLTTYASLPPLTKKEEADYANAKQLMEHLGPMVIPNYAGYKAALGKVPPPKIPTSDDLRKTLKGSPQNTGVSQWFINLFGGNNPPYTNLGKGTSRGR